MKLPCPPILIRAFPRWSANRLTVLSLNGDEEEYEMVGVFRNGEIARSRYFAGLTVAAAEVFALSKQNPDGLQ